MQLLAQVLAECPGIFRHIEGLIRFQLITYPKNNYTVPKRKTATERSSTSCFYMHGEPYLSIGFWWVLVSVAT